jgi:hypothetical protein
MYWEAWVKELLQQLLIRSAFILGHAQTSGELNGVRRVTKELRGLLACCFRATAYTLQALKNDASFFLF